MLVSLFRGFNGQNIFIYKGYRPSSAPPDYLVLYFIAIWAWKLLNKDLIQKYIP